MESSGMEVIWANKDRERVALTNGGGGGDYLNFSSQPTIDWILSGQHIFTVHCLNDLPNDFALEFIQYLPSNATRPLCHHIWTSTQLLSRDPSSSQFSFLWSSYESQNICVSCGFAGEASNRVKSNSISCKLHIMQWCVVAIILSKPLNQSYLNGGASLDFDCS